MQLNLVTDRLHALEELGYSSEKRQAGSYADQKPGGKVWVEVRVVLFGFCVLKLAGYEAVWKECKWRFLPSLSHHV